MTVDTQAVLEGIAAVVEVFEIQRGAIGRMGQALDAHDGAAFLDPQCLGQGGIGEHRVDGEIRMAEGNAAVVLEDQENVAGDQVGLFQLLAHHLRQVGHFQGNRLAIDQAHPLDFGDGAAFLYLQALGHERGGGDLLET
ncbi:hypothetical protein D3C81_1639700 [compost metagenome]